MFRWLLSAFRCPHTHTLREMKGKTLHLTCVSCGDSWPALTYTAADRAKTKKLLQRLKASQATADVRAFRRAK